jgi:hypothetical protein
MRPHHARAHTDTYTYDDNRYNLHLTWLHIFECKDKKLNAHAHARTHASTRTLVRMHTRTLVRTQARARKLRCKL